MRIALVSRQLATHARSGLNRATCDLARGLAGIGHEVHVIAEHAGDGALDLPAEVHDVSGGRPLAGAAAGHGRRARRRIDVASMPLWGATGIFAVRDPRFPTVVSCMTSATTIGEIDAAWLEDPEAREAVGLERVYVQGARHLHGLTRAGLEKTVRDYGGEPLTSRVVARGLSDIALAPRPREPGDTVEILFVGRNERRKGVDVLLDATSALIAEGAPVRLTLAGAENGRSSDRVRFEGVVSDERLRELYAGADIVCQPSRYESHGIVLVEAMMFGKPIVATTGGGIPEVLEHDGNALLAEPGDAGALVDALRALVSDPERRARLAARSRERYLERFEIGAVARQMTELFEEAIDAHERHPAEPTAAALLARSLDERAAAAEDALADWAAYGRELEAERGRLTAAAIAAEAERDALRGRVAGIEAERDDWRRQTEIVNGKLWHVTSSRTWRLTEPLRGGVARVARRRGRDGTRDTTP
jgi:glycosyltransferase involved in cell wall biosynthesis